MEHHACQGVGHTHNALSFGEERQRSNKYGGSKQDDGDHGEKVYYQNVCKSFRQYATFMRCNRYNHTWRLLSLPESQRAVLPKQLIGGTAEWTEREKCFQSAELQNQFFLDCILKYHGEPTSQEQLKLEQEKGQSSVEECSSDENISKVQSVLKSLARDWSSEMAMERNQCYGPLLDAVGEYLSVDESSRGSPSPDAGQDQERSRNVVTPPPPIRISVPGAGVSRLALELSAKGYEVQCNELSFHMLLASDFLLNACTIDLPFRITPWLGPTRNLVSSLDTTRQISIPDVDPVSMVLQTYGNGDDEAHPEFSMAAGDFAGIYSKESEREQWDAVVSCFFLDTAPSIVEYLQIIWNMLKEGGLLFNFGPLLYHWSAASARPTDTSYEVYKDRLSHMDSRYTESIDLSWEEVKQVMCSIGFEVIEERQDLPATYTADEKCMMNSRFSCIFFVAKKIALKS